MWNSCKSVFPNTFAWEQQERNNVKKQTHTIRREAAGWEEVKRERKKSPGGLSLPNLNTIIINIIFYNFLRYGKSTMEFN